MASWDDTHRDEALALLLHSSMLLSAPLVAQLQLHSIQICGDYHGKKVANSSESLCFRKINIDFGTNNIVFYEKRQP